MNRLLRPEKFDTSPEDSESTKIIDYWLRIFEGLIAAVVGNAGGNEEINKLALLINFLTHKSIHLLRKPPPTTKPRQPSPGLTASKRVSFSADIY